MIEIKQQKINDSVVTVPGSKSYTHRSLIAAALSNAKKGNLDNGFVFAGSNAYRVNKILSVKELIDSMTEEYEITVGLPEKKAQ